MKQAVQILNIGSNANYIKLTNWLLKRSDHRVYGITSHLTLRLITKGQFTLAST